MFKTLSAPVSLQWELTPWCNHNCIHCYNFWRLDKLPLRLSNEDIQTLETAAREVVDNKVFHVTVTGGEPLSVLNRLKATVAILSGAGVDLSINTNLTLLNSTKVALLKELGFRSILTSLMASDPEINDHLAQKRGAFTQTIAGVKLAIKSGFPVAINMVVSKANQAFIDPTAKLAKELGAVAFTATKASAPSNCPDFSQYQLSVSELQRMFVALHEASSRYGIAVDSLEHYPACVLPCGEAGAMFGIRKCSAGKTGCTIGFDGQIRPCSHASDSYGHISDGLKTAWQKMSEWRDGSLVPQKCKACQAFPKKCSAGCRVEAKTQNGSLAGPDPFCIGGYEPDHHHQGRLITCPPGTRFSVERRVSFRPEHFGGIAYLSSSRWIPVDAELQKLLVETQRARTPIDAETIAQALHVDATAASQTLSVLAAKNIITADSKMFTSAV